MPLGHQVRTQHPIISATNPPSMAGEAGLIVTTWDGVMTPVCDETVPGISSYHINGSHTMDLGSPALVFVIASVVITKPPENFFSVQEYSRTVYEPGMVVSYTDANGTTSTDVHRDLCFNGSNDFAGYTWRTFSGVHGFAPAGPTTLEVSFTAGFGTSATRTVILPTYWYGTTAAFVSY